MQALDGGLGDYTQWVHSACPHWTYYHLTRSVLSSEKHDKAIIKTNLRPLPMSSSFYSGLGDYPQWVHSACPHWTRNHSTKT